MTTYQPNIPTGLINLDTDYTNLRGNFQQLDTSFKVDHVPLTNINGAHTVIHMVPFSTTTSNPPANQPVVAPPNVGGLGELFCAQITDGLGTDEALYYQSGGGKLYQLTRNKAPNAASTGISYLPGGIIMMWGQIAPIGLVNMVSYSQGSPGFPTGVFNLQLTLETSDASDTVVIRPGTSLASGFTALTDKGTGTAIYWVAIGI